MVEDRSRLIVSEKLVFEDVLKFIKEITSDWEMEFSQPIGSDTYLGADIGFQSMDLVRLISEIQQNYDQALIPFEELFLKDGAVVADIRVSELVAFLAEHMNSLNTG